MNSIAIVGTGTINSIGSNTASTWDALLSSHSGLKQPGSAFELVASLNFDRRKDLLFDIAKASIEECISEAGWSNTAMDRTALIFSHGSPDNEFVVAAADRFDTKGRCRPDTVYRSMNSYVAARLSREFLIRGPVYSVSAACAGSSHAINLANSLLNSNAVDRCLCGGGEVITRYLLGAFAGMRAVLSAREDLGLRSIQPFGIDRSGIALGEGCGWIALERAKPNNNKCIKITESRAINAPEAVYGDVLNQNEWDRLLEDSSIGDCDLVIAHATSTPKGDLAEGKALLRHCQHAEIRSTKFMFGHTLSASSILDIIAARQSMLTSKVFTNGHSYTIEPELENLNISSDIIDKPIKKVAKISAAFGGALGLIVLENENFDIDTMCIE